MTLKALDLDGLRLALLCDLRGRLRQIEMPKGSSGPDEPPPDVEVPGASWSALVAPGHAETALDLFFDARLEGVAGGRPLTLAENWGGGDVVFCGVAGTETLLWLVADSEEALVAWLQRTPEPSDLGLEPGLWERLCSMGSRAGRGRDAALAVADPSGLLAEIVRELAEGERLHLTLERHGDGVDLVQGEGEEERRWYIDLSDRDPDDSS